MHPERKDMGLLFKEEERSKSEARQVHTPSEEYGCAEWGEQ